MGIGDTQTTGNLGVTKGLSRTPLDGGRNHPREPYSETYIPAVCSYHTLPTSARLWSKAGHPVSAVMPGVPGLRL